MEILVRNCACERERVRAPTQQGIVLGRDGVGFYTGGFIGSLGWMENT